jgi:hypothetical protein
MSCRTQVRHSAEQPERPASAHVSPAGPLEPAVEHPRRIDAYIDYFGTGDTRRTGITSDPDLCGEVLLDGDGR